MHRFKSVNVVFPMHISKKFILFYRVAPYYRLLSSVVTEERNVFLSFLLLLLTSCRDVVALKRVKLEKEKV